MTTSVVVTTYNGEKFIVEQLDRLRLQTHSIDEVLIFDDCSNDNTVFIVSDYIESYGLKNWVIQVNEKIKVTV